MDKKYMWLVFKIMEFLLTLACCWLILWRSCQDNKLSHLPMLYGFYGVTTVISLTSLIATFFTKTPKMSYEAAHAGIFATIHLIAVFLYINIATIEECMMSVFVALCATAVYLMHCNWALNQMFADHHLPGQPQVMPPFYFQRAGIHVVHLCEPLPSTNGPMGLPPV